MRCRCPVSQYDEGPDVRSQGLTAFRILAELPKYVIINEQASCTLLMPYCRNHGDCSSIEAGMRLSMPRGKQHVNVRYCRRSMSCEQIEFTFIRLTRRYVEAAKEYFT